MNLRMPKAPIEHGIPVAALLPVIYENDELFKLRNNVIDNYATYYKNLNILRDEMMYVMMGVSSIDVLSGTSKLDYMN